MKQKNLLVKGMSAAAVAALLVFAVALAACDNTTTMTENLVPPPKDTVQEIQTVEVESPDVQVSTVTAADIEGIFGYKLTWKPIVAVKEYEIWRKGSAYEEWLGVLAEGQEQKSGDDIGLYVFRDIVKLDNSDTPQPTLEAGKTYTYTVIAIPIDFRARDTGETSVNVTAPAVVARDTQLPAPGFELTIDPEKREFVMKALPPDNTVWPVDFVNWSLYDKDDRLEKRATNMVSGNDPVKLTKAQFKTETAYLKKWENNTTAWRSRTEGTYTLKGISGTENGYFKASEAGTAAAVFKLLFLDPLDPKTLGFVASYDPEDKYVKDIGSGNFVEGYFAALSLDRLKGRKEGTYTIERQTADGWETIDAAKLDGYSDYWESGYIPVTGDDMTPDHYGDFRILIGTGAGQIVYTTVYDRSIAFDKKGATLNYRIKGEDADGLIEYIWSNELKIPGPKLEEMITLNVGKSFKTVKDSAGSVFVSSEYTYVIMPDWKAPFRNMMDEDDTVQFFFRLGGGSKINTHLISGYKDDNKYEYDPQAAAQFPMYGHIVFTRDDVESYTPKKLVISPLDYVDYYDDSDDDHPDAADTDEVIVTAFVVEDGIRKSIALKPMTTWAGMPTAGTVIVGTVTTVTAANAAGVGGVLSNDVLPQYPLTAFTPVTDSTY